MERNRALENVLAAILVLHTLGTLSAAPKRTIHALFIGNSYTFRNDLPEIVKRLVEEGNADIDFQYVKLIYGGQTLHTHWEKFRSQSFLMLAELTKTDLEKHCAELAQLQQGAKGKSGKASRDVGRYGAALRNHKRWLSQAGKPQPKWDYVVLQSYRDTAGGLESRYAQYARKFAPVVHRLGAKPILYATFPKSQNAKPLDKAPDPAPAIAETKFLASLAKEINALVVPVAYAINRCQTARPDLTLRWIKDSHLNQRCSYLTGCAFYGAMFGKSPEGLAMNWVNDPRIKNRKKPDEDPDGGPRHIVLPDDVRACLQKAAWEAVQGYERLAAEVGK